MAHSVRERRDANTADLIYHLKALGDEIKMNLKENKDLFSPGCVVHHMTTNGTGSLYPCASLDESCYFFGHVENRNGSWVALSICDGMNGVISLPEKNLVVKSINHMHLIHAQKETKIKDPHLIYETSNNGHTFDALRNFKPFTRGALRQKRTAGSRYIETLVVADASAYRFHGPDTSKFVKTALNVAAQRFLDPALPEKLYMTLTKLVILEDDQADLEIVKDASITLENFCHWQVSQNPDDDHNSQHADYAILITKVDLVNDGNHDNSGLAYVGGMCGRTTKCSVNEDSGPGTGMTIAHETGHCLGMSHDSDGNSCPNNLNIMSSMGNSGREAFKWSSCSVSSLKNFLRSSDSSCLNDQPSSSLEHLYNNPTKPGTAYSMNAQCKLIYGPTSDSCKGTNMEGDVVCRTIECNDRRTDPNNPKCLSFTFPALDGTECGHRKWCIEGHCVPMGGSDPAPVNGGWSEWDHTTSACTRTCGGGVRTRKRRCDNPEPRYSGQPCQGSDVMAEICNIQDCPTSQLDYMAEQCAATDSEPLNGKTYHWVPLHSTTGHDGCIMNCFQEGTSVFYLRRPVYADGTACISDSVTPFSRCVSGQCRDFGCDGLIDSGQEFDKCGVCNGAGNTCRKESGTYHGGQGGRFVSFLMIPTGSTGITITQKNMFCYLSIAVGGQRLFNDDGSRKSGEYSRNGVMVKYSSNPEKVEIVGPLPVSIQAEVYRQYPANAGYVGVDPDINYEYYLPIGNSASDQYSWHTTPGTCSKTCGGGQQVPEISCIDDNNNPAEDFRCSISEKPSEVPQPCNTLACPPRWRTGEWDACSMTCGGGQRHRSVECVQEENNIEKVLSAFRCNGTPKPAEISQCNTQQCSGVWKVGPWGSCSKTCGRGVKTRTVKCYQSLSSDAHIPDSLCPTSNKPIDREVCVERACRTDITGSACQDQEANCFGSYGQNVCEEYASWSTEHCMKSCGICLSEGGGGDVGSADLTCVDKTDCASYGSSACTEYKQWAGDNCQKFCGLCGDKQSPVVDPNCVDKLNNCVSYGSGVCESYKAWAGDKCAKFCGFCGRRKKRVAIEEKMMGTAPNDDIKISELGELPSVPFLPYCDTVRTANHGVLDLIDKLPDGATCVQTIALPLEQRVLLRFNNINMDCDKGDSFEILDGEDNLKIPICGSVLDNEWLSSGSIVTLKFRVRVQGHGYNLTYEAFPKNASISACSKHLTDAVGIFSSSDSINRYESDLCLIYITGTPGKKVRLQFNKFTMPSEDGECGSDIVKVDDLEGGESRNFCGEKESFSWESSGSRVRVLFKKPKLVSDFGFMAKYVVLEI
ncbi:hypothetical protein ACJMK2_038784 [Sinanodonta woodiana]|uniref:Uncharacterized protein n=1 Tax=Sinanodonta woodiana TaxID=1069815 RepID=A0ABD3WA09_SINWO